MKVGTGVGWGSREDSGQVSRCRWQTVGELTEGLKSSD